VSCDLTRSAVHGYFDGELSAASTVEFKRHLEHCSDCVLEITAQEFVRESLQRAQLYELASDSLKQRIRAHVRSGGRTAASPQRLIWRWLAAAAALLLVALFVWRMLPGLHDDDDYQAELAAGIVDAHVRSLQPGHLTNVDSTDQRTVKEWFDGKAGFAFPVRDLTNDGFSLLGGRLDIVQGRTVAVLAYARLGHVVNVFMWPTREAEASARVGARLGYQWVAWQKDKMEFCAVSDAPPTELEQLHQLIAE
jgi:anti-sigma factor RsiW